MSFDFTVSDTELGSHIEGLEGIRSHTATAKSKVEGMPDVLSWTEFVVGILGSGMQEAMFSFKDDTVAAHDALGEIKTQVGYVRDAYNSTELTNSELVTEVEGSLDEMPTGD